MTSARCRPLVCIARSSCTAPTTRPARRATSILRPPSSSASRTSSQNAAASFVESGARKPMVPPPFTTSRSRFTRSRRISCRLRAVTGSIGIRISSNEGGTS